MFSSRKRLSSKFQSPRTQLRRYVHKSSSHKIRPVPATPSLPLAPIKPTKLTAALRRKLGLLSPRNKETAPAVEKLPPPAPVEEPAPEAAPPEDQSKKKAAQAKPQVKPNPPATPANRKPVVRLPPLRTRRRNNTVAATFERAAIVSAMSMPSRMFLHMPGTNPYAPQPKKPTLWKIHSQHSRSCRQAGSALFDYDLSQVEQRQFGHLNQDAMKSVPASELQLLRSGQRATYLETRYERTPDDKYNYPEATSMRYGWFHRQGAPGGHGAGGNKAGAARIASRM